MSERAHPDMQNDLRPFHLAFPVSSLHEARWFYGELLGCPEGRSSDEWVDFNFFGHQIVAHLDLTLSGSTASSQVDGHAVPVKHFGLVLPHSEWEALVQRLIERDTEFLIQPTLRFAGSVGEQWTCFLKDPSGNALEFKSMTHPDALFKK